MPPPPPGADNGKKVGIAVAVVLGLVVLGGGAYFLFGDSGGGTIMADDGKRYELALPKESGEFTLIEESDDSLPSDEELAAMGLEDMEGSGAVYMNTDPNAPIPEDGTIAFGVGGMWGEIENPEEVVDGLFALAAQEVAEDEESEVELVGEPSTFTDTDVVMKCQNMEGKEEDPDLGYRITAPVCVWADYSTMGFTYFSPFPTFPADFDPNSGKEPELTPPVPMVLDDAADHTKQMRTDSLVEASGGKE